MKKLVVPVLAAAAVIAVVIGAVFLFSGERAKVDRPAASSPAPRAEEGARLSATAPVPALQSRWQAGLQRRYLLEAQRDVRVMAGDRGREVFSMGIRAAWITTVVGVDGEDVQLLVRVVEPELSLTSEQGSADRDARAALERALAQPFYLTLSRRGRVELAHFAPELDPVAQTILRSLAAATQLVRSDAAGDEWESEETDTTGDYVARYQRMNTGEIRKTVVDYLRLTTPAGMVALEHIGAIETEGGATIALAQDGAVHSLDGRDRVVVQMGQGQPAIENLARTSLTQVSTGLDEAAVGSFEREQRSLVAVALSDAGMMRASQAEADAQILDGASYGALLAALSAAVEQGDEREVPRLIARFAALFRLQPETTSEAAETVLNIEEPVVAELLTGALATAETAEAQSALAQIALASEATVERRLGGVAALGLAQVPTDENMAALRSLAEERDEEIRGSAVLAMGTVAGTRDDAGGEALVEELIQRLAASQDVEEQVLLLEALGNTRDARALPAIEQALRAAAPQLRGAAVKALRFMDAPRTDELLAAILLEDPNPGVRQNVLFAAGYRPLPGFLPVIKQVMSSEDSAAVRMDAVQMVGSRLHEVSEARALIGWVADNDDDEEIRAAAREYLAGAGI